MKLIQYNAFEKKNTHDNFGASERHVYISSAMTSYSTPLMRSSESLIDLAFPNTKKNGVSWVGSGNHIRNTNTQGSGVFPTPLLSCQFVPKCLFISAPFTTAKTLAHSMKEASRSFNCSHAQIGSLIHVYLLLLP